MTFRKNIRYLRKKNHLSQEELAARLGYKSFTTVAKWESGVTEPTVRKLKEIAQFFGVDTSTLLSSDIEEDENRDKLTPESYIIPVLGRVAAGKPVEMIEDIICYENVSKARLRHDPAEYFGLKIAGDSMEPRIHYGDIVIVHKQPDAESGDVVIATIDGEDAACKRLKKYDDSIALISDNPKYPPLIFSSVEVAKIPVQILGVVTELRGEVK